MNTGANDPAVLADRLRLAMEVRAQKELIVFLSRVDDPDIYTGQRLRKDADDMARLLRDWLGPGAKTLVLALPAGSSFVVTLIACLFEGITVVPVTIPRSGTHSDRFAHVVQDCGAQAVICAPRNRGQIINALSTLPGQSACPVVALPLDPAALPACAPGITATGQPAPAVIQYTSGSTKAPKGVRIMPWHIVANGDAMGHDWHQGTWTRAVNWLPHFHDMGLMSGILYPVLWGGISFQMSPQTFIRNPKNWLRAISDHRATYSGSPAFGFAECIRRIAPEDVSDLDLSCLQAALCGAEPVPVGLLDRFFRAFEHLGLDPDALIPGYGMAEYTLYAAGCPGRQRSGPPEHGHRVQPSLLSKEAQSRVAIVDPDTGQPVPEGDIGEIWLRGPSVGDGYLDLPEETAATFGQQLGSRGAPEWLRTGDLGARRENALWVTGRLKDVIICNGAKISAAEIEHLACALDPALNPLAAAAFMPDEAAGGRAVLIAETHLGRISDTVESERLQTEMGRLLMGEWGLELSAFMAVPRGTLARTSSGKIQRRANAAAYRDGGFAGYIAN